MEAGVRRVAEPLYRRDAGTVSAYLTFVAGSAGQADAIPQLILETADEQRRNREAQARREARLREKSKEKACQLSGETCD